MGALARDMKMYRPHLGTSQQVMPFVASLHPCRALTFIRNKATTPVGRIKVTMPILPSRQDTAHAHISRALMPSPAPHSNPLLIAPLDILVSQAQGLLINLLLIRATTHMNGVEAYVNGFFCVFPGFCFCISCRIDSIEFWMSYTNLAVSLCYQRSISQYL
jgi:hypothetical protein